MDDFTARRYAYRGHRKSVCLSVTLVDFAHMVRPAIMIFFTMAASSFLAPNFVSKFQWYDLQIQGQREAG